MGQLKINDKNVVHEEEGNIVVVNTCGFIDNAKEESVNTILEQSKAIWRYRSAFVTGCLSERYKPIWKRRCHKWMPISAPPIYPNCSRH